MAAIKFSKQYIEPNPNEIDYWVDLSSNQYGGRMKYYNGFEWVDLVNPDGTHIDINDFYNKLQINQMLSQKASVDSVESKVDDDEVSDVIKNISFSQRGEDGIEMVMFKYDDTTVGIQLPIADNTKSGIITKDTFKNLVNQTQLQQLYSEMYTKLSEIRNNYQPKLRAGANIKIENNVISAVSKIGTDWNDIANKPDIYDKSQVDTMMSGVYKIKGSRRFEALPLYTNTVGDTYNITNDFSLHGEDYPMGTNVVWTENGWDALAGIFDTSELEEDIQEVKDNYLPLSGGRLNSGTDTPLIILGTDHSWIGFKNSNGTDLGWIGVLTNKLPSFYSDKNYKIWHEGNDGEGSGLDADTLDGMHLRDFFDITLNPKTQVNLNSIPVNKAASISWDGATSSNVLNKPDFAGASLFHFPGEKGWQFCKPYNKQELLFRDRYSDTWFDWKTMAFSDGYYKDMHVGLADDLGDIEETIESEYVFQPTANPNEIRDGYAHILSLKGNSVVWNQLTSVTSGSILGVTFTKINDTTCKALGVSTGRVNIMTNDITNFTAGDKLLFINSGIEFEYVKKGVYIVEYNDQTYLSYTSFFTSNFIYSPTGSITRIVPEVVLANDAEVSVDTTFKLHCVNLTKMFGEGNEPETVEEFYARIPQGVDLDKYNEGEIINLTADSIKSVGFNQWDEEWELGYIDINTGIPNINPTYLIPSSFIKVLPNTEYYSICKSVESISNFIVIEYDSQYKFIKHISGGSNRNTFTTSKDTYFIKFVSTNTIYDNDICINLSNPDKNGTYKPYKEFVRQLPTNLFEGGMKSAGDVYDEIYWDKNKKKYIKVTRIGSIDLGSLDWIIYNGFAYTLSNPVTTPNVLSTLDSYYSSDNALPERTDLYIQFYNNIFRLRNIGSMTSDEVKNAVLNVMVYYELAEPIIEELDIPYMDYEVSNDGTEMIESSTPTTPIKANVTYNFDAINTIKLNRFDISDIKKGATKLATPVKLWGNDFDGSSDINGLLKLWNNTTISWNNSSGEQVDCLKLNDYNNLVIGEGVADSKKLTIIDGYNIFMRYSANHLNGFLLNESGNVGIGTIDPLYKLDVNGSVFANHGIYLPNNTGIYTKNSDGESINLIHLNVNNVASFGYATMMKDYDTSLCGNRIIFATGDSVTGMMLNQHGNLTIGKSDLASTNYKLCVDGAAVFNDNVTVRNSANVWNSFAVGNKITSGDLVDWYGVSWSEDSSDPTCTRIGNMALHRSLPILSAMKGYYIANNQSLCPEYEIPLKHDWSSLCYNVMDNSQTAMTSFVSGNIMVKIPEFWYIDDYEPSTKTHNLKISQTAKAGWCHHKEAYVGAYEGRAYDTHYKSVKGVNPTVSLSRTELRPLARANGFEDEYKWNIYTYEEHRAICHLFLVEYATRNSQAPVNTALTADGFKQGGLGSGCTTGTATINGQTTYSFIPTGTTDSLGNGSGQVAYTVTQTDADGNGIGTVTRYANRYRGIENPFGHIWKHVDDIVNVYNAETTYKTVYKCNKPEHFATNKNAKYKPLCSFPGGSKMQGWSKEIKATINCDFFKYSVGGSESTYWCDYNYDNDDTSEHCLLVGGGSGDGGWAGLFYFALGDGVGYSYVSIGSRLTYLPWAE